MYENLFCRSVTNFWTVYPLIHINEFITERFCFPFFWIYDKYFGYPVGKKKKTIVWLEKFFGGCCTYTLIRYSEHDPFVMVGCIIYDILLYRLYLEFRNILHLCFLILIMQQNTLPFSLTTLTVLMVSATTIRTTTDYELKLRQMSNSKLFSTLSPSKNLAENRGKKN